MMAKPIIDIDIVIEARCFPTVKERLAVIGYFYRGNLGIQGREVFDLINADDKSSLHPHHLYVCDNESDALREHIAFRDFMKQHPEWRQRLSALKRSLCEQHNNDRQSYMDGKADMVREITEFALKWIQHSTKR